jgi:hypothetical protein
MSHPLVENHTKLAFQLLLLADEEGRPLVVPVLKGTFDIQADGRCTLAEEQAPIEVSGKCWGDDPEKSSYRYEPEVAFFKPGTDVVLNGHACAPHSRATQVQVGLTVGPARKTALVQGDRVWFRSSAGPVISRPVPFEKVPLVYERAFGGWDKRDPDPNRHACEPRNPVGAGFRLTFEDGAALPNLEDPAALISSLADRPSPVGFGFVSPHWQPRAALAGTYDASWQKLRAPFLPTDFDRRHLNAASPGLVVGGYLRGGEQVTAMGVTPRGTLAFTLPSGPPPKVRVVRRLEPDLELRPNLDTVIIEPDESRLYLLWRAHAPLRNGPHDLKMIHMDAA